MFLLVLYAVLSIGVSFLCSILEAALLSLTPSYIAHLKDERPRLHDKLYRLKNNIDQPLSAILTLNTIAHTAGATGVGAQVAVVFGETYLGVASALMTLMILIVSEIIPKTLGATYWRQLSRVLPAILNTLVLLLKPFVWLSELITTRISKDGDETDLRSEIKALTRIAHEEQALDAGEARSITNILNLHTIRVRDVMTPRTVAVTVQPDTTVEAFDEALGKAPFTRFPVIDGGENAMGYVHKSDIYQADRQSRLKDVMRPVNTLTDTENVEHAYALMLKERHHMCAVYDDLGIWVGVITFEDIIEAIVGHDIMDETDNVMNMRKYARQRWTRRQGV
ncbi:CNNM domain-containing protein [Larsenimonas suaedae]|uniref:CNNM domain-containing protein n=1 Tax=Larsenimonas suaedae TaxID=1851019 RepID=A0ABU1GU17_9GAMM|nr:CNNM domain-containing protein [Larsenimonas suaedae]MCM2971934.1 CNNM domain-containing protein [Larsenimonas suaedae]MDR5895486.1 CNNM domain-containing protein [Larsenimonas suaedae]